MRVSDEDKKNPDFSVLVRSCTISTGSAGGVAVFITGGQCAWILGLGAYCYWGGVCWLLATDLSRRCCTRWSLCLLLAGGGTRCLSFKVVVGV